MSKNIVVDRNFFMALGDTLSAVVELNTKHDYKDAAGNRLADTPEYQALLLIFSGVILTVQVDNLVSGETTVPKNRMQEPGVN